MSYVVSIQRELPITEQELMAVIDGDRHFSIAAADDRSLDSVELSWKTESTTAAEFFILQRGVIEITSPTNSALEAAKSLAALLSANIVGEDGEDLTNVNLPENDGAGCGSIVWVVLAISALILIYWFVG